MSFALGLDIIRHSIGVPRYCTAQIDCQIEVRIEVRIDPQIGPQLRRKFAVEFDVRYPGHPTTRGTAAPGTAAIQAERAWQTCVASQ